MAFLSTITDHSGIISRVRLDADRFGYRALLIILAGIAIFFIVIIKSKTASELAHDPLLVGYTFFVIMFQFSRLLSALLYKPSYRKIMRDALAYDGPGAAVASYEPSISFVVPCKNEEAAIENTVTQCFAADYPKEKLEVIVINDGSTDRTGKILERLQSLYPNLTVVTWTQNRGKRHGMAEGFFRARGELIIQLDSDSYLEPSSLRSAVAPFRNPGVGASSVHTDPQNADVNFLTKMQAAYYFMAFRILKAAESTYGVVFCCSGCASVYRKDIVVPILDDWLMEKFLKLPVTWGDDRSLTNRVLKLGYKTIYTDEARAFTVVPETFLPFIKQQIRWKKGWLVNSIFASKFIVKRDAFVAFAYFFPLTLVTILTPFMAARALVYTPLVKNTDSIGFYVLGVMLVAALLAIYYRTVGRTNKYWPYLFAWALINMFFLSMLLPYALADIQNRKWGTR